MFVQVVCAGSGHKSGNSHLNVSFRSTCVIIDFICFAAFADAKLDNRILCSLPGIPANSSWINIHNGKLFDAIVLLNVSLGTSTTDRFGGFDCMKFDSAKCGSRCTLSHLRTAVEKKNKLFFAFSRVRSYSSSARLSVGRLTPRLFWKAFSCAFRLSMSIFHFHINGRRQSSLLCPNNQRSQGVGV